MLTWLAKITTLPSSKGESILSFNMNSKAQQLNVAEVEPARSDLVTTEIALHEKPPAGVCLSQTTSEPQQAPQAVCACLGLEQYSLLELNQLPPHGSEFKVRSALCSGSRMHPWLAEAGCLTRP